MEICKVYLVVVMSLLFVSLVVSDHITSYNIKREVFMGLNPAQYPDLVPIVGSSNDNNYIRVIKRQVLTGPNPT